MSAKGKNVVCPTTTLTAYQLLSMKATAAKAEGMGVMPSFLASKKVPKSPKNMYRIACSFRPATAPKSSTRRKNGDKNADCGFARRGFPPQ